MISQDDITSFSLAEYSFLRDDEIAVEINLDFRDFVVDLFIVRLEDGKLPKGYYVSAGRKLRIFLLNILADKSWPVDEALLINLRTKTNRADRDSTHFKKRLYQYRLVLTSFMDKILEQGTDLFN